MKARTATGSGFSRADASRAAEPPEPLADAFLGRRMVLCSPCGSGALLGALRERGVPGVGLDRDHRAVQAARGRGLLAFHGDWRALAWRPPVFDGICASWNPRPPRPELVLDAYAEALLDGGLLVLTGSRDALEALDAALPPTLELGARSAGARALLRRNRTASDGVGRCRSRLPAGAFADLFVGARDVLELASGEGRFLDALRVRDLPCSGLEHDPARVARCRARGLDVELGAADALARHLDRHDAIWLGRLGADAAAVAERAVALLRLALRALRPDGVLRFPVRDADEGERWIAAVRGPGIAAAECREVPRARGAHCVELRRGRSAPPDPKPATAWWPGSLPNPLDDPWTSWFDLERFERRDFSQGGEDGVLEAIFARIGVREGTFVELGCGDAVQCNTKALRERGWRGVLVDGGEPCRDPRAHVARAWLTAENVEAVLDAHDAPAEPDLVSIDLDGNDYWIWNALRRRARVVVVEYNANWGPDARLTIPYDPAHRWDGTDFYGASLAALVELGRSRGYSLVHCSTSGVNAFFVAEELVDERSRTHPRELYRPPNYWYRGARHAPDLERRPLRWFGPGDGSSATE